MEPKLVYRALRKISDWTVNGYYSDVHVEGKDNLPAGGPTIVASTHHNEIIDIATLATTIPHQRHLSFWAKSTMFSNPLMGAILDSSGAIPVRRNPNTPASITSPPGYASSSKHPTRYPPETTQSLFESTSARLASYATHGNNEGVVGIFPEGTSYTQASIVQVLPGAAWAAVEYIRWRQRKQKLEDSDGEADFDVQATKGWAKTQGSSRTRNQVREAYKNKGKGRDVSRREELGVRIVPVAIVYTDKAKYMSRVFVKYGEPIDVEELVQQQGSLDLSDEANAKASVKAITEVLSERLRAMTINASDWDVICAVSIARTILWGDDDKIDIKEWVEISQRLVKLLDLPQDAPPTHPARAIKKALTTYYALLHHTGISHSVLASLLPFPNPNPSTTTSFPTIHQATLKIIPTLPFALLRFALFIPPLAIHLPAYATSYLAGRLLSKRDEEETEAQFKSVGGGVGLGIGLGLASRAIWRRGLRDMFAGGGIGIGDSIRLATLLWAGVKLIVFWHRMLAQGNYRTLQMVLTYTKLITAYFSPSRSLYAPRFSSSQRTRQDLIKGYTRPPQPAVNPYIKKHQPDKQGRSFAMSPLESISTAGSFASFGSIASSAGSQQAAGQPETPIESLNEQKPRNQKMTLEVWSTLVREVVDARREASVMLWGYLRSGEMDGYENEPEVECKVDGEQEHQKKTWKEEAAALRMFLEARGAKIPSGRWYI